MFASLVSALEGVAAAIREGSNRAPDGVAEAREQAAALAARLVPLESSEQALRAGLARQAAVIAELQKVVSALSERADVKRLVELEAEVAALRGAVRKLNGKLYGDPETRPAREASAAPAGINILGLSADG